MRSWILPAVAGACLAGLGAGPAEAAGRASHGQGFAAATVPGKAMQPSARRNSRPGPFVGFPFALGGPVTVLAPGELADLNAGTQPIVVTSGTPPVVANTHPSVETTPEGVTIVRGTGSHHIPR